MKLVVSLIGLLCLCVASAQARPIGWVPPEKLEAAAEVIVNGVAGEVTLTDTRSDVHLGPYSVPTREVELSLKFSR